MSATQPTSKNDFAAKQAAQADENRKAQQDDPLDEAVEESFPASDPPAFTGTAASPSKRVSPEAPSDSCRVTPK